MPTFVLTDTAHDVWVETFAGSGAEIGLPDRPGVRVEKRTLRGGRRHGVDLIRVDNGALSFAVVPTRGMGLWEARLGGDRVGWRPPVADGPVNPAFVELESRGGLGWLKGFDELLARCGLENNGAPYRDADGRLHTLHGRIATIPAHYVAVRVDEAPPHAITVEGHVDEAELFFSGVRLVTTIRTVPGSNKVTVRDEVRNLRDVASTFQLLYHWNFGPPHLEEGSRFVAPGKVVCPRDETAVAGIGHFDVYPGPQPGTPEAVYFFELHGEGPEGRTVALLRNRAGDKGVALRFSTRELPCFTLWKNPGGLRDGYVTGLEPATNYPNPRPVEEARGRVARLDPGASRGAETTLEVLADAASVAAVEAEVAALQGLGAPTIHPRPVEPFAPEA